jgi:type IV pilus assembly protein PilB
LLKRVREFLYPIMDKKEVEGLVFYEWVWCDKCNWSWHKWRLWIHEVLIVEQYLEEMILNKASANEMTELAVKHWMITILQDSLIKAAMWLVTVEESLQLI